MIDMILPTMSDMLNKQTIVSAVFKKKILTNVYILLMTMPF